LHLHGGKGKGSTMLLEGQGADKVRVQSRGAIGRGTRVESLPCPMGQWLATAHGPRGLTDQNIYAILRPKLRVAQSRRQTQQPGQDKKPNTRLTTKKTLREAELTTTAGHCGLPSRSFFISSQEVDMVTKYRRAQVIRFAASEVERRALASLAEKQRRSLSETLREMLRAEAQRTGVWPEIAQTPEASHHESV